MAVEQTVEQAENLDKTSQSPRRYTKKSERDAVLRSELERGASYSQAAAEKVNETNGTETETRIGGADAKVTSSGEPVADMTGLP